MFPFNFLLQLSKLLTSALSKNKLQQASLRVGNKLQVTIYNNAEQFLLQFTLTHFSAMWIKNQWEFCIYFSSKKISAKFYTQAQSAKSFWSLQEPTDNHTWFISKLKGQKKAHNSADMQNWKQ